VAINIAPTVTFAAVIFRLRFDQQIDEIRHDEQPIHHAGCIAGDMRSERQVSLKPGGEGVDRHGRRG
jgi:hypothetical protein